MYFITLLSYLLMARLSLALKPKKGLQPPVSYFGPEFAPLRVDLAQEKNTLMRVAITNQENRSIRVLKTGTILDDENPVRRLWVQTAAGEMASFTGTTEPIDRANLSDSGFRTIRPKQTIFIGLSIAETYDLSKGGEYDIFAQGTFLVARGFSNHVVSVITYESNVIRVQIDGAKAAIVHGYHRLKRHMIADDCSPRQIRDIKRSLDNCVAIARAGEWGAKKDPYPGYMDYFFQSNTPQMRRFVADVFKRLRHECSVPTDGVVMLSCGGKVHKDTGNKKIYRYEKSFWKKERRTEYCDYDDQAIETARMLIQNNKIGGTTHLETGRDPETGSFHPSWFHKLDAPKARANTDNFIYFAEVVADRCFVWEWGGFFKDRGVPYSYVNPQAERNTAEAEAAYWEEIID
ncbi:hypothetical protein CDD80_5592 [Ophiocordyceps camponoti-rufipedis]|uniref:deuterolysin n=1 Tax=Ophiocordyceps camponoti-rufipedis TaxID=2004952 RepID=A0A2C5ZGI2_9HYPO|nr:hypothetical protein CDD80_5592 [Ophiocordyceps camponoti-rufipedis]